MKNNSGPDLSRLNECADYILEHEMVDFEEYVEGGSDPYCHIYSVAYIALHGEKDFQALVEEILNRENREAL